MTTPLAPGVYVKEVPSGVRSIIGAGTSTPAFIGLSPRTDHQNPAPVRNWNEFASFALPTAESIKAALTAAKDSYTAAHTAVASLAKSIKDDQTHATAANSDQGSAESNFKEFARKVESLFNVAKDYGFETSDTTIRTALNDAKTSVENWATKGGDPQKSAAAQSINTAWKILTDYNTSKTEDALAKALAVAQETAEATSTAAESHAKNFDSTFADITQQTRNRFNLKDVKVLAATYGKLGTDPNTDGCLADAVLGFFANGGSSCYVALVNEITEATLTAALKSLEACDVAMVAVPDLHLAKDVATASTAPEAAKKTNALATAVVKHCERMKNRVAILHIPDVIKQTAAMDHDQAIAFRNELTVGNGTFASLYYPWVQVNGVRGTVRWVPPVGHVAGVWAATDTTRGVFKAPANVSLAGVIDLKTQLRDDEQADLNSLGVNCLRSFPGRPLMVWGARTLAEESDRDWKYLNVRRLVCFLSDSIHRSTSWAVFEPNDEHLWATLRQSASAFLKDQWRLGALQGATPDQAFHVVCDESNNPEESRDKGEVHCDIYVAPVRPAEFVHFAIQQTAGKTS
ncbi:phage tail sheath family protein [Streptomyces luteireticuli]|uniref:phage tail sheath family protein n=1 Tax=Streptomyces luteireticuli TaxID=173858 RepID=UPI003557349F